MTPAVHYQVFLSINFFTLNFTCTMKYVGMHKSLCASCIIRFTAVTVWFFDSSHWSHFYSQQDKLQMVFEAIQNHRQRNFQGETVTYPLPPRPLIHHEGVIHRQSSRSEEEPNLEQSVSVMGVASAHSSHDNTHPRVKVYNLM